MKEVEDGCCHGVETKLKDIVDGSQKALKKRDKNSINVPVGSVVYRYAICGVIYLTDHHFTSHIIKTNNSIWSHGGILTGAVCELDGNVHLLPSDFLNTCDIMEKLVTRLECCMRVCPKCTAHLIILHVPTSFALRAPARKASLGCLRCFWLPWAYYSCVVHI
jgi:hypothetical protein